MKIRTDSCGKNDTGRPMHAVKSGEVVAYKATYSTDINYYIRTTHNSSQSREIKLVNLETGKYREIHRDILVRMVECELVVYEE